MPISETRRVAKATWAKTNAKKQAAYRLKSYYKSKYGMTREETLTLSCVRYLYK
jgi:hypothetical protein